MDFILNNIDEIGFFLLLALVLVQNNIIHKLEKKVKGLENDTKRG